MNVRTRLIGFLSLIPALLAAATIDGDVKDPSGAAVPAAAVTLKNPAGAIIQTAETDKLGHFTLAGAPPGKYELIVQHPGFEASTQPVELAAVPLTLTIALKIGAQETVIEVGGKRSALANSDPSYVALRNAMPGASYRVRDLTLKRDVGVLTFVSGNFNFVPPVLGRVAAAVFTGEGRLHLEPAMPLERDYLQRISGNETVDEPFQSGVFWFTDDTVAEIKRQAQRNRRCFASQWSLAGIPASRPPPHGNSAQHVRILSTKRVCGQPRSRNPGRAL